MSHTLLAISLILLGLTIGGNSLQTGTETNVDLLKSLIYDNTKATVTLDSAALKQLIQFSSGNLWNNFIPLSHIIKNILNVNCVQFILIWLQVHQTFDKESAFLST